MNVLAYCTLPARATVSEAVGGELLTSPPAVAETFDPGVLSGRDLIYFRLHGYPWIGDVWFGEDEDGSHHAALYKAHLAQADLHGTVVIVANCHGADSPMVDALYSSGASSVIAGEDTNYAGGARVIGTDKLAQWLLWAYSAGMTVAQALAVAKARLALTAWWRQADLDAMAFRIVHRKGDVR